MVEKKTSVYDEVDPPLVEATNVPTEGDLLLPAEYGEPQPEAPTLSTNEIENVPELPTEQEEKERQRMMGAGVASGIVGLLLGGPIFAMILGFGAAHASKKIGSVGDTARAMGDAAMSAKAKALEIDEKHKVTERSKAAASSTWTKAQEMDTQYHYLDRSEEFLVHSWTSFSDYVRRNKLLERGVDSVGQTVDWATEKCTGINASAMEERATV
jgi:hypothetical protein